MKGNQKLIRRGEDSGGAWLGYIEQRRLARRHKEKRLPIRRIY
jgi:hypothetical protein